MTDSRLLYDIGTILVNVTFLVSVMFILIVSTFWKWWNSDFGWTVILKTGAISVVLLPFEIHYWFNISLANPILAWTRIVGFTAVPVVIVWRLWVIWELQKWDPPVTKDARSAYRDGKAKKASEAVSQTWQGKEKVVEEVIVEDKEVVDNGTDGTRS